MAESESVSSQPAAPWPLGRVSKARVDAWPNVMVGLVVLVIFTVMLAYVPRMTGDTFMALAGARDMLGGKMGQPLVLALARGQFDEAGEILVGNGGEPDDWSFITEQDQVWVNQNWGANLILYGFYQAFGGDGDVSAGSRPGDRGIVTMKMTLVVIMSLTLFAASRLRHASWTIAMLVTAMTLSGMRHYVDMRANLFTLTFVPVLLWSLYWSGKSIHRIWLPVGLLILWSHVHAAWVFGYGMLGLWCLCQFGGRYFTGEGEQGLWKRWWPYLAAPLVVPLVSALTSPHGIRNVTYTFESMIFGDPVWHQVDEWRPIFAEGSHFGSPAEFGVQAVLMIGVALVWGTFWMYRQTIREQQTAIEQPGEGGRAVPPPLPSRRSGTDNAAMVFEIALWLVAAVMALSARRFIALPLLTGAPLLARAMTWLLRWNLAAWITTGVVAVSLLIAMISGVAEIAPTFRIQMEAGHVLPMLALGLIVGAVAVAGLLEWRHSRVTFWPVLALAVVLVAAAAPEFLRLKAFYRADNPFMEKHTLFQRMITWDNFPGPMSKFINANDIHGNVHNDWRWESFLVWYCQPNVQVYLGGRAQTIYTPQQYKTWRTLGQPIDSSPRNRSRPKAAVHLPRIGCNLLAHPRRYQDMVMLLCFSDRSEWVPVFYDGHDWLCAYAGSDQTRGVIQAVLEDRLTYPSEGIKAVSKALALGANMTRVGTDRIVQAIERAVKLQPETALYALYLTMVHRDQVPMSQAIAFLQSEAIRLSREDYRHSGGGRILDAQLYLVDRLARAYEQDNRSVRQFWQQRRSRLNEIKRKAFYGVELPPPEPVPRRGPPGSLWPDRRR